MTYIYGDIIIIENFIMNFIILWLTAHFSKIKTKKIKITISSIMGAFYAVFIYLPFLRFLNGLPMKVCLSILMIAILFTPVKIKVFLKSLAIFYLISFIFGGVGFALICMANAQGMVSEGILYIYDFPMALLLLTCILGAFSIKYSWNFIERKIINKNLIRRLNIFIDGNQVETLSLFDTANFLYDPISKLPVIIVEYDLVKDILPPEIRNIYMNNLEEDFNLISEVIIKSNWISRFRMIPFSSIGKQNGLLIGFKTDKVVCLDKREEREIRDVIMAIYKYSLCKDGEYNGLIHPEVLNNYS